MTVTIKTSDDIKKMCIAGRLVAEALEMISEHIRSNVTIEELDRICHGYIINEQRAILASLNYEGLPKSACISIDHMVCHGIPSERSLKEGGILNVNVTVIRSGYHDDTSKIFLIGKIPERAGRLCQITQECVYKGISVVRPDAHLGDIGGIIQKHTEKDGFSVVHGYCGHDIDKIFHEEPQVLHYGRTGTGIEPKGDTTFTVEPMVNRGRPGTHLLGDGWIAVTKDHKPFTQREYTMLVIADDYEVPILRDDKIFPRTSAAWSGPVFATSRTPRRPIPFRRGRRPDLT